MTFIVCAYIFWVSPENLKGAPLGFGLPYKIALMFAIQDALILGFLLCSRGKALEQEIKEKTFEPDEWDSKKEFQKSEN